MKRRPKVEPHDGDPSALPEPVYTDGRITLYQGDFREIGPLLPRADVVIVDPPYSERVHGKSRTGARMPDAKPGRAGGNRNHEIRFAQLSPSLRAAILDYASRARRWSAIFSDLETAHRWYPDTEIGRRGLELVRVAAWHKLRATPQFTGDRPGSHLEAIVLLHPAGKKRWNGGGSGNVFPAPVVQNGSNLEDRVHETQKPIGLMRKVIELFSDPDEMIVDCTSGSGTTLEAARDMGRCAIGVEMNPEHIASTIKRLRQVALPFTHDYRKQRATTSNNRASIPGLLTE